MEELNLNEIVKIEQLPKVYEQLDILGAYVDEQLIGIDTLECTEENKKKVKELRTKISNFLNSLEDKRKDIKKKINEPYDLFNNKYEQTTKIKLQDAYKTLTDKINKIEDAEKLKKKQEVERYFNEYSISKDIDFVKFEQLNLNITLSASETKLKEQVKVFVDKVVDDLNLIVTQEHKQEIMLEYKKTLNVSASISNVTNRYKELEELKKKEEEKAKVEKQVQESVKKVEKVIAPPIATKVTEQEELLEIAFKVKGSRENLKELVRFLKERGYDYEQC